MAKERRIRTQPGVGGHSSYYGYRNQIARILWGFVFVFLFRPSPRSFHRWRNWLLRLFGAKLHPTARVYPHTRVWAPWKLEMAEHSTIGDYVDVENTVFVRIGAHTVVSQYCYLCGGWHDYESRKRTPIIKPITIGRDAWIAADVFVTAGVTIGDGAVVAARSSVFRDVEPWKIYMGTPAKPVRDRVLRTEEEEEEEEEDL